MTEKAQLFTDRLLNGWTAATKDIEKAVKYFWLDEARIESGKCPDVPTALDTLSKNKATVWAIALRMPFGDGNKAAMLIVDRQQYDLWAFAKSGEFWTQPLPAMRGAVQLEILDMLKAEARKHGYPLESKS